MLVKIKNKQILQTVKIVTWTVFIGLCIKIGTLIYTYLVSVISNDAASSNLYLGMDLSSLENYNFKDYSLLVLLIILLSGIKALMFYYLIKIFKIVNYDSPFTKPLGSLIKKISFISLAIGFLATVTSKYTEWLIKKGVDLGDVFQHIYGGREYLFIAIILFTIYLAFKIGIEYQSEIEETV